MNTEVKIKIGDNKLPVELHVEVKARRYGRKWTRQEEKKLASMLKHDWPYALMVTELQRTETAIKSHLQRMGLLVWNKEKREYVKREAVQNAIAPKKTTSKLTARKKAGTKAIAEQFPDSPRNRVGKHWTKSEEARLDRLYKEGKSVPELMALMGRTESSIMGRLVKFGYFEYDKETKQYVKK